MSLEDHNFELITKKNGKDVFRCKLCKKTYKMLGEHIDNHAKTHTGDNITPPKPRGKKRITKEKFDAIKEMQFRGETRTEIHNQTGVWWEAIRRVLKTETYEQLYLRKPKIISPIMEAPISMPLLATNLQYIPKKVCKWCLELVDNYPTHPANCVYFQEFLSKKI